MFKISSMKNILVFALLSLFVACGGGGSSSSSGGGQNPFVGKWEGIVVFFGSNEGTIAETKVSFSVSAIDTDEAGNGRYRGRLQVQRCGLNVEVLGHVSGRGSSGYPNHIGFVNTTGSVFAQLSINSTASRGGDLYAVVSQEGSCGALLTVRGAVSKS